jgi:hypothetical protein
MEPYSILRKEEEKKNLYRKTRIPGTGTIVNSEIVMTSFGRIVSVMD